jgi:hypothetical protein
VDGLARDAQVLGDLGDAVKLAWESRESAAGRQAIGHGDLADVLAYVRPSRLCRVLAHHSPRPTYHYRQNVSCHHSAVRKNDFDSPLKPFYRTFVKRKSGRKSEISGRLAADTICCGLCCEEYST